MDGRPWALRPWSALGELRVRSALDEQWNEVPNPAVFELGVGALDDRVDALYWDVCVAVC